LIAFVNERVPSSDARESEAIIKQAMGTKRAVNIEEFSFVLRSLLSLNVVVNTLERAQNSTQSKFQDELRTLASGAEGLEQRRATQRILGKARARIAQAVFKKESRKGDGSLDSPEAMNRVLLRMGIKSEAVAHALFRAADANNDGRVELSEYMSAVARAISGDAKFLFDLIDADNSGDLDAQELETFFLALLPGLSPALVSSWVEVFISRFDTDADGEISLGELLAALESLGAWRRILDAVLGLIT
jgi:Ca2+-binding EF-hand superfamily protein